MRRPNSTVFNKRKMILRVSILSVNHWKAHLPKFTDPAVQHRNDQVSFLYSQSTARAKIILNIYD
jgi:hypothetical protein